MRMNDFDGKQFLADVRSGDFAHAGEEESIQLMFTKIPKKSDRLILDAGCGRGGTADYVHRNGWGDVVGIDVEAQSIEYAQNKYPELKFEVCDVCDVGFLYPHAFDLIYMFNAFYAVEDKAAAMQALRHTAKSGATLCIFDYTMLKPETPMPEVMLSNTPATPDEFLTLLKNSGFKLIDNLNLDQKYIEWYRAFVSRFDALELKEKYPEDKIAGVREKYSALLQAHEEGLFGGTLLTAVAE